ncbi:CBS domain-containing protein [uncultured Nitrospira sp.]|uniref:CBS domain-containing protein n=1 Tax=uncultured Nitrospira sp. TaxID=157176 RepID=UPI0031408EEB
MEIITTHLEADFDGLASMVAAKKLYPKAHLVLPAGAQSRERAFLAEHPLSFTALSSLNITDITRLILVDAQHQDRLGPLEKALENQHISVHIYDHHPIETTNPLLPRADYCKVDSVGATITLLCEELQARGLTWTPEEATFFAIALYEETGQFVYRNTTPRDFQIGAVLVQTGADLNQVTKYIARHWTPPQLELFHALLQSAQTLNLGHRRILLITLTWPDYVQDMAPIVQQLAQLHGADAIIAAVAMEGKVQVIGRSRHPDMDMNQITQAFGGGGHTMAAAASIKKLTIVEVEQKIRTLLEEQARTWLPIKRLMTTPVRTVDLNTTIKQTERLMTQYEVNALPVVNAKGGFMGLATRESVQKALYHKLATHPIDHIMSRDIFLATPATPFDEVEQQMIERNQRVVPVLDQDQVVGIFSRTDLLRAMHQALPPQEGDVEPFAGAAPSATAPPAPTLRTSNLHKQLATRLPPPLQALLQTIEKVADTQEVAAFLVGGFVRDFLMNIPNFDLDVVIEGDGIRFGKALAQELKAEWTIHERFGTVSIALPKTLNIPHMHHLDIATARTEYYEYPTALPTVERSSIKKDLYRRDFTINALAIRLNGTPGELLDFFGGRRDIKDRIVRVLHSLSFVEDPTRVFRAIRFEQRFGFQISKETQHFIQQAQTMELFHRLSGTRLGNELIHILEEPEPAKGIQRLSQFKLFPFIHPKLHWKEPAPTLFASGEKILAWHEVESAKPDTERWLLYALAWFESLGNTELVKTWKRLGFPQRTTATVGEFLQAQSTLIRTLNRKHLAPSEIYDLLKPWPKEVVLFLMAKAQSKPTIHAAMERIRDYLTTFQHVVITVTGHDLEDMGLPKGPAYRRVLDRIFKAKLDSLVVTQEDEYRLAKTFIQQETASGSHSKSPSVVRKGSGR